MTLGWNEYPSKDPEYYAREVIRILDIKEPPVCEREVAAYFGNKVMPVSPSAPEIKSVFPNIEEVFSKSSAHLFRQISLIVVNEDQAPVRIRMDVFHENGHEALPWQRAAAYVCADSGIDRKLRQQVEDEAFRCGIAMMLPAVLFQEDMKRDKPCIKLVKWLADRYQASLEVTARRFVELHPWPMAMVVITPEQKKLNKEDAAFFDVAMCGVPADEDPLREVALHGGQKITLSSKNSLHINYGLHSGRFPKTFFEQGTSVSADSIICATYKTGLKSQGCKTLEQLGLPLGNGVAYNFECHRFGIPGARKILLLLWCEDIQQELF